MTNVRYRLKKVSPADWALFHVPLGFVAGIGKTVMMLRETQRFIENGQRMETPVHGPGLWILFLIATITLGTYVVAYLCAVCFNLVARWTNNQPCH